MGPTADRPSYRPSGRVDPTGLVVALPVLGAASAGVAAGYFGMLVGGVYFAALAVVFPAIAVAALTRLAVKYAHCRNPVLAGALGAACGLAGYLCYFHVDQCRRWQAPVTAVHRLPDYLAFRMETDRWQRAHKGAVLQPLPAAPGIRPARPLANADWRTWTWAGFFFEVLVLAAVPLVVGVIAAREPYSEKRKRWCSRELLVLEPEAGKSLKRALNGGSVAGWVESGPRKVGAHEKHSKVSVWYTPFQEGEEPDAEVFVAVGDSRPRQLFPEEAAALVQLLPAVQDLAGPARAQLAAEADRSGDPTSARVWPVPPPYAGQSQNPRNRFLGALVRYGLLIVPPLLAFGALVGGTYLMGNLAAQNRVPGAAVVGYVITAGILCLGFLLRWFHPERLVPVFQNIRLDHWLIRRAVTARPDPLVPADDPEAVFAEMTPRRLWSGGQPQCGLYNQGLLRVDYDQGAIRFEGDYERYWIPANAILGAAVEVLPNMAATTAAFYAVVLHARLGSGVWEVPLFPLANIEGSNNWERANALLARFEALCGRPLGEQPPAPPKDPGPVIAG